MPLHPGSDCEFLAPERMFFNGYVSVGDKSFFSASDGGTITVGHNVSFNRESYVEASCGFSIKIYDWIMFGPRVLIHTGGHKFSDKNVAFMLQGPDGGDIIIESDVWVGAGVIILGGVHIYSGAVIGAGSVITKDVPSMAVVVGNGRVIKYRA